MGARRIVILVSVLAVMAAALVVSAQRRGAVHPGEVTAPALMTSRADLMKKAPMVDAPGVYKIWETEHTPQLSSELIQVYGTVPMHFHPDGSHRLYMIEGEVDMVIGDRTMHMRPGDYMMIPRGVRHKVTVTSQTPALAGSVAVPPFDPARTVWIEPRPAMAPAEERPATQPRR
ncbi:MAG: cupin domain-containing protein [Deltaproteobacteria bacterium]|nr:cupin domain-containing protein [Deltaproteobacteria bacterium]